MDDLLCCPGMNVMTRKKESGRTRRRRQSHAEDKWFSVDEYHAPAIRLSLERGQLRSWTFQQFAGEPGQTKRGPQFMEDLLGGCTAQHCHRQVRA